MKRKQAAAFLCSMTLALSSGAVPAAAATVPTQQSAAQNTQESTAQEAPENTAPDTQGSTAAGTQKSTKKGSSASRPGSSGSSGQNGQSSSGSSGQTGQSTSGRRHKKHRRKRGSRGGQQGQAPQNQAPQGQMPGGQASGGEIDQGSAATTISEDSEITGETYTSEGDDENALRVDGAAVTLADIKVDKSAGSSSSPENGDFYGVNAGLLATNGATVEITGAEVTTSAQNGNGVFSYGEGTTVTISDSTIDTTADNSGGIQTTGGGTTIASDLTVTTAGNSSAAIRSDRGGGTVRVTGGSYTSSGYNSPAVYSTADIEVTDASLTAENSEALVIEGKNSIALTDCDVTGNMSDDKGSSSSINVHGVMIYQSMSGDADVGTASFSMKGGSLNVKNGDVFYVTNTACTIDLEGVAIASDDEENVLMCIAGNDASHGWGTAGSNGGDAVVTCRDQELEGIIEVDSASALDLTLSGTSSLEGQIVMTENEAASGTEGAVKVTIEEGAVWNLTGDSQVTELSNRGTVNYNGYTITLADGTVLGG